MDSVDPHDVRATSSRYVRLTESVAFSAAGVCIIAILALTTETRSGVLLTRLARKLRQETGDSRYRARAEDERGSLKSLIYISLTRPICTFSFLLQHCLGAYKG